MLLYPRDATSTLYLTTADINGSPIDSDTVPLVGIWKDNVQVVADMPMIRTSVGFYYVDWFIPITFPLGDYAALYTCTLYGVPSQGAESFTVIQTTDPQIPNYYCSWDDVLTYLLGLDIGDIPATLQSRITQFHIPTIKKDIDTYCRQNFNKTTVTEFFDGTRRETLVLPRRPISQLISCVLRVIPSISWYTFRRWRHINVIESTGAQIATQGGPEPINDTVVPPYNPGDYVWESTIEKADLFVDCANGVITIPPRILYLEMQAIPFWNYTFLHGNNNVEVKYEYGYDANNFPQDLRRAAAMLVACQVLLLKGLNINSGAVSVSMDTVSKNYGPLPYSGYIEDLRKSAFSILDRFRRVSI